MRCFVKATERYMEEAQSHHCMDVFKRFRDRAEANPNFDHPDLDQYGFSTTDGKSRYLKKIHQNFRSILAFQDFVIANKPVRCYVALTVFCRGDNGYKNIFLSRQTDVRKRDTLTGLVNVDWAKYEQEIREELEKKPEILPPPTLSADEVRFVNNNQKITQEIFDIPVYESKTWVSYVLQEQFDRPVEVAEKLESEFADSNQYGLLVLPYGYRGENILCYRMKEGNSEVWFLLEIGQDIHEDKWREELAKAESPKLYLIKQCHRAYPFSMLDDKDFWLHMEKDKDSNFILSEEEMRIVSQPLNFPVFISGRAGSGKSTVLQYLFAEFLLHYLEKQENQLLPPVYLSYSENLIDNAKKLSKSLFTSNHVYSDHLKRVQKSFVQDVEPMLNKTFFEFQKIVRECIAKANPEVLKKRFPTGKKYITYTRFRKLWEEKFGCEREACRDYGPALSWHVIRTYIKGWDSEAYCDPDEYEEIGRKNHTVTSSTFRTIFERVWEGWYQPLQEKEGYWDDQDLVRYCLAPDDGSCDTCVTERFSAVVCDEAQDFTRVETDFILRLSSFSHRTFLDVSDLEKLPFIFAGDEFQTINPTGFSWDSLRSYFTKRLADMVGLKPGQTPSPIPLTQNYRSTVQIVKLGNRLQLLRSTRCRSNEQSKPQVPYFSEDADSIYCLPPDDPQVWQKLKEMEVVLIIPSADGQKPQDFIEKSPIKGMLDFYEDGSAQNITIYNPIQAKGLEYPCVAIYGFDLDEFSMSKLKLDELSKWYSKHATIPQSDEEEERELELRYQLSNAYVSATRAKNKLFILSDFDQNSFWTFAYSTDRVDLQDKIDKLQGQMLDSLPNSVKKAWTTDMLGYVLEGEVDAITGDNIAERSAIIQRDEERGISLGDASMLRQVAARYRERGDSANEVRCEAWACWFDGLYMTAGEKFLKAQLTNEAISAFWRAYAEGKKAALEILAAQKSKRLEVRFAVQARTKQPELRELKLNMAELFDLLNQDSKEGEEAQECTKAWTDVINEILGKKYTFTKAQRNDMPYIIEYAEKLATLDIQVDLAKLAIFAFQIEDYKTAATLWEKSGKRPFPPEYHFAKTQVLDYPADLEHWESTRDPKWELHIVERYRKHVDIPVDVKYSRLIGKAILKEGTDDEKRQFLPLLLANAESRAESLKIIDKVEGLNVNTGALIALIEARWTHLSEWKMPNGYVDPTVKDFLRFMYKMQYMWTPKFMNQLNEALGGNEPQHVWDFMENEFGKWVRMPYRRLMLTELGALMESRGYLSHSIRYYDWALHQTTDPQFIRELNVRILACKERMAARLDNPSEELLDDIKNKREELGFVDKQPPAVFQFQHWEAFFKAAAKFSAELTPEAKKARDREIARKQKAESVKAKLVPRRPTGLERIQNLPPEEKLGEKLEISAVGHNRNSTMRKRPGVKSIMRYSETEKVMTSIASVVPTELSQKPEPEVMPESNPEQASAPMVENQPVAVVDAAAVSESVPESVTDQNPEVAQTVEVEPVAAVEPVVDAELKPAEAVTVRETASQPEIELKSETDTQPETKEETLTEVVTVPVAEVEPEQKTASPTPASVVKPRTSAVKAKPVKFEFGEYTIQFNPSRFRLSVSLEAQDVEIKFRDGECQDEDGLYLKGDKLVLSDDTPTPFAIELSENAMTLVVLENGEDTGVRFSFAH